MYRFRFRSPKILDLRLQPMRHDLGLSPERLAGIDTNYTQLIGEIARALGIEAITAPSPSGAADIIAIFPDLKPESTADIRHVELWARVSDIPGATDESSFTLSRMTS